MKAQRIIRMQMMLIGLGAAMLLASPARAQQDMDPTGFDVNPGTPKVERQVAKRAAAQSVAPAKEANAEGVIPEALWSGQATKQEADFSRMILVDAAMVMILIAGVVSIVLYAMAATKRERRLDPILQDSPYGPVSGATTH
jgi:hypothetical protein